jgi:hypothetical protein
VTDDLAMLLVQARGQLSGIAVRSALNSIPSIIAVAAGAPITLAATSLV